VTVHGTDGSKTNNDDRNAALYETQKPDAIKKGKKECSKVLKQPILEMKSTKTRQHQETPAPRHTSTKTHQHQDTSAARKAVCK
jgi:hypothetical protein